MSDPNKHTESDSVRLSEMLKASVYADIPETTKDASEDEQDDLAAILRAQLPQYQHDKTVNAEISPSSGETTIAAEAETKRNEDTDGNGIDPALSEPMQLTISDRDDDEISETSESVARDVPLVKPGAGLPNTPTILPQTADEWLDSPEETDSRLGELKQRNDAWIDEAPLVAQCNDPFEANGINSVSSDPVVAEADTNPAVETATHTENAGTESVQPEIPLRSDPAFAASIRTPLQTDFDAISEHTEPSNNPDHRAPITQRKPPRVSRMFGVYRIQERPAPEHIDIRTKTDVQRPSSTAETPLYTASMLPPDPQRSQVNDAKMMLSMGYEHELRSTEERQMVEEARRSERKNEPVAPRREASPSRARKEFSSNEQTPMIEAAYRRALWRQPILFLLSVIGCVLVLLYDLLPVFDLDTGLLGQFSETLLYPLIELGILLLVCIPFATRLLRGIVSLLEFEPTRYALSAMALLVTAIHAVLACFAPLGGRALPLFGGVALVMLAVTTLSEFLATIGERLAFTVASFDSPVYVLTDDETPASKTLRDDPKQITTASSSRILTAVRCARMADYFARTARYNPYMGRMNYLLPASLLLAIIMGGMSVILGGHPFYDGIRVFTATYLAVLPMGYIMTMALPLLVANERMSDRRTAIIGTAAPADLRCSRETILIFPDGPMLDPIDRRELALTGDDHVETYRHLTSYLLSLLHMPGTSEELPPRGYSVELAEQSDRFLRVYLIRRESGADSRTLSVEVMLGSRQTLERRGIRLPKIEDLGVERTKENTLYIVFNQRFRRLIMADYRIARAYKEAKDLPRYKGRFVITSLDPMNELSKLAAADKDALIIRPAYCESPHVLHTGAVVSNANCADLLDGYITACRMNKAYRIAHIFAWLWMAAVAVAIVGLLVYKQTEWIDYGMVIALQLLSFLATSVTTWLLTKGPSKNRKSTKASISAEAVSQVMPEGFSAARENDTDTVPLTADRVITPAEETTSTDDPSVNTNSEKEPNT